MKLVAKQEFKRKEICIAPLNFNLCLAWVHSIMSKTWSSPLVLMNCLSAGATKSVKSKPLASYTRPEHNCLQHSLIEFCLNLM